MAEALPNPLVVIALQQEAGDLFAAAGVPVLFCGIGKVNAAMRLTRKLAEYRHAGQPMPTVINFGTVGSQLFTTHTVVACRRFVQRDMDVSGLGFAPGVTPFEDLPAELECGPFFDELPEAVCGSGDSFETTARAHACDVIDMEAYALAKVCLVEGARFACAKYVTDGADHAAAASWQDNVRHAAAAFLALYRSIEPA